jgi:dTDP-4-dehydrorhamnose 3,5-epimerase
MKFLPLRVAGACVVKPELMEDERGFFARTWCEQAFEAQGLNPRLVQSSVSFNTRRGTLRGMHYQAAPHAEAKLVRCTMGVLYDVVLDLRQDSPTFRQWAAVELTAQNRRAVYVPAGCAHGFLTLQDQTEALYQMSAPFHPESARGVRWNDPAFGITWPLAIDVISCRDASWPDYRP